MSDSETEIKMDPSNPDVVTKYKTAATIVNAALKKVTAAAVAGAKIIDLCIMGDEVITKESALVFVKGKIPKGVAFPTCISVNNIVCHYSPVADETEAVVLKDGDVAKIEMGAQIDGFPALVAHTIVIGSSKDKPVTGRKADLIKAAYLAAEAALRTVKPGRKSNEVTEIVSKVASNFSVTPVEGMLSHEYKQNSLVGNKQIILNPSESNKKNFEECEFAENEVYGVDILISSGDGKCRPAETRTTLFKKEDSIYQLKMKTSRAVFSEVNTKFGNMAFNIRSFEDEKKARMGLLECVKHEIVTPFEVLTEKEGEFVAHFMFTVLLMPNGPLKITEYAPIEGIIQSEMEVKDEEIKTLLASAVRSGKSKKNKKSKE